MFVNEEPLIYKLSRSDKRLGNDAKDPYQAYLK